MKPQTGSPFSWHIGSSMMELNVCGAIPPYNEILAGKLVALLATSPQVIHDYKERYSDKASMIASRLKGEDVFRPADLVYVGGAFSTGVHNVAEPSAFANPVVFGPKHVNSYEAVQLKSKAGGFPISNQEECYEILSK